MQKTFQKVIKYPWLFFSEIYQYLVRRIVRLRVRVRAICVWDSKKVMFAVKCLESTRDTVVIIIVKNKNYSQSRY